jgi:hypothetical protein
MLNVLSFLVTSFCFVSRAFALNIGIKFATPEAYFLGENEPTVFEWDGIDPTRLLHELERNQSHFVASILQHEAKIFLWLVLCIMFVY